MPLRRLTGCLFLLLGLLLRLARGLLLAGSLFALLCFQLPRRGLLLSLRILLLASYLRALLHFLLASGLLLLTRSLFLLALRGLRLLSSLLPLLHFLLAGRLFLLALRLLRLPFDLRILLPGLLTGRLGLRSRIQFLLLQVFAFLVRQLFVATLILCEDRRAHASRHDSADQDCQHFQLERLAVHCITPLKKPSTIPYASQQAGGRKTGIRNDIRRPYR